jgi:hypothetical protein
MISIVPDHYGYHSIDALSACAAVEAIRVMEGRADINAVSLAMLSMTGLEYAEIITQPYPAVSIV